MTTTAIEWTANDDGSPGKVWNPTRGCVKVSPGCKHCYAETFAERWRGVKGHPYEQGFDPRLVPDKLGEPFKWKKGTRIFVNSMSDLFGEFVPNEYLAVCWGIMAATQRHTHIVLTKRAERLHPWFEWLSSHYTGPRKVPPYVTEKLQELIDAAPETDWPLPNVWLGVSVEDRKYGVPRIDQLRQVPAAVRVLSIEPLLEDLGELDLTGIGWVLVGGESGAGARPFQIAWARSIRDQCRAARVPFFFKQAGAHVQWDGCSPPGGWWPKGTQTDDTGLGHFLVKLKAKKGGDMQEWPEDLRVREFPEVRNV